VQPDDLYSGLLWATGLLLVAVLGVRLSSRTGLPSLLIYLALGVLVGESGPGRVTFEDFDLAQNIGLVALAVILAEGGLTTRWSLIRPVLGFALVLSTLGVAISVAVVAAVTHLLLGVDIRTAVLLGAVLSSTDAAAVFSVLRTLPLQRRLRATLEAESGCNDAPTVILVGIVIGDAWEEANLFTAAGLVVYELIAGTLIGIAVGRLGQVLLARIALPATGLYPLATLALTLLSFSAAGHLHASGFIAVYVTGLWLGNAALPHRRASLGFAEGAAWLAQIGLFVLLGLLASPDELDVAVIPAILVGLALLLLARPLSVVVCALPFGLPWREQAFLSWAGLRGAVPIVLATIAVAADLPTGRAVFNIVFVLVVVFTLVQAPTLPLLARWLRVAETDATQEVELESAPLAEVGAEIIQITIPERSRLAGVTIAELRLPPGAAVTLVVRQGAPFVPERYTSLSAGDRLLIVATAAARSGTEHRLRAVSRAGRLARWRGEPGALDPGASRLGQADTPRRRPIRLHPHEGGMPWPRARRRDNGP
jgi:cell volume regulation protein A